MASSSGTSSGSSMLQNSGSEEDLQLLLDQKKLKRKQSNRESARRSRMRKQKQQDDLAAQMAHLRETNSQILSSMNITTQNYLTVESENSVLRTQIMELNNRLQSLNEILQFMNGNIGFQIDDNETNDSLMRPWEMMFLDQPIMASANMF